MQSMSEFHFCGSFCLPIIFFSLRSEEFLSAFQDIWEHLNIIISKWTSNEGKGFCQIFAWALWVLAAMLHFICLFVQCQTCYRCCQSLTYAIIIGWAQEMQIAEDLLKCILKGLQMSVPKSNYHFLSLNLSFFLVNLSLTFYALGRGQMQPFICGGGFSSLAENCQAFRAIG